MKTKLGTIARTLLIGLAGAALVATTLGTSNVSACMRDRAVADASACTIGGAGVVLSIGPLSIVIGR